MARCLTDAKPLPAPKLTYVQWDHQNIFEWNFIWSLKVFIKENTDVYSLSVSGSIDAVTISEQGEPEDPYRCQMCTQTFRDIDSLYAHQNESGHLELTQTPRGPGYLCWRKGCNQYFKTTQALQVHFREIHAKMPQLSISERHVYKFRCTQCSLAFKTLEKLQLHTHYHMVRAATKCSICQRNFRSIQALQKHVETTHLDSMTEAQLAQFKASLATAPPLGMLDESEQQEEEKMEMDSLKDDDKLLDNLDSEKDIQYFDEYINNRALAEDSYNNPSYKFKCHRCKVAFVKQSYLSAHNKTLMHRRGDKFNYTMEKYMDPNRPYKCETCMESFTQKNILLVHFNSVSHLHKLKQASLDSPATSSPSSQPSSMAMTSAVTSTVTSPVSTVTTPPSSSPSEADRKPYRCNICRVSYSQGSNLDIHIRSVLHQTRAAKLQELVLTGKTYSLV